MSRIIISIVACFAIIGAIDKLLGNKKGYGKEFEKGFLVLGNIAIPVIGMITLAPLLSELLKPIISTLFGLVGADPSMFAGTMLALDMGGYHMAKEMALTKEAGDFAGFILGSTLGPTISFTIPVAIGLLKKDDITILATGILAGMVTIPIGCVAGGLVAGFKIQMILVNLIPIIILSIGCGLGTVFVPKYTIKGFLVLGRCIEVLMVSGTILAILQSMLDLHVISNLNPLSESVKAAGTMALYLSGAFPLILFLNRLFSKFLNKIGSLLNITSLGVLGMMGSLTNNIMMLKMFDEMNEREKVINTAFTVGAGFMFSGCLAIPGMYNPKMILPVLITKIVASILAVGLSLWIMKRNSNINNLSLKINYLHNY